MSCYTRTRLTENPEFVQLQERCTQFMETQRRNLFHTFAEFQEVDKRLGVMTEHLDNQIAQYKGVVRSVDNSVTVAREYLSAISEQMAALKRDSVRLRESSRALLQASEDKLEVGLNSAECMTEAMAILQEATLRAHETIQHAPESLNKCFKKVEDRLADLMRVHSVTEEKGRDLDQTWQQVLQMHTDLAQTRDEWQQIHAQLAQVQQSISSRIGSLTLVAESMDVSRAATYALLDALQDRKFDLIAYERTSDGIEAFLEDEELRKVAFRFTTDPDLTERILLELNVSDFAVDEMEESCEEITEQLLDVLAETGIMEKTRTERPHRDNFGKASVRVGMGREKESTKDNRLKQVKELE